MWSNLSDGSNRADICPPFHKVVVVVGGGVLLMIVGGIWNLSLRQHPRVMVLSEESMGSR